LSERQIAELIQVKRASSPTREQELASFRELFTNLADPTICEPCAVAVLNTAAVSPAGRQA
jgi:hypothetical protein